MKPSFVVASLGLVAFASSPLGLAQPPAQSDQVVASFQRMFAHEPTPTAPRPALNQEADPLRTVISAVLWEKQPTSFHVATRGISAATPGHRH